MRLAHFETLQPVCPVCLRRQTPRVSPLRISRIERRTAECIHEGLLVCSDIECAREFPIIDDIPILMPDVAAYVERAAGAILWRGDLSAMTESLIGDCLGPTSDWDVTRQHLSSYVWDHYGEFDTDQTGADSAPVPGSVARLRASAAALRREVGLTAPAAPLLDVGCSVGRTAFAMAREVADDASSPSPPLVLGIDAGFAMLRIGQQVLRSGQVRYARRRTGLAYERREFSVPLADAERVDFWACDALTLPFASSVFGHVNALNVLDSVSGPSEMLAAVARVLRPDGDAVIACPFDWSPAATPVAGWIGGHSDRAEDAGAPVPRLRYLLDDDRAGLDLQLLSERDHLPWTLRLHDRSFITYEVQMMIAGKRSERV